MGDVVKTTKGARTAAIDRVIAGLSSDKDEARKLRVNVRVVRKWVTMEKRRRAIEGGRATPSDDAESAGTRDDAPLFGSGSSSGESDPSPDLDRARASAGLGEASGDPEEASSPGAGTPGPAPSAQSIVAIASVTRSQLMRFYAGVIRLDPADPRVRAVFTMPEEEKAALQEFAPAVAGYFPALFADGDGKAGLIAFATIWGLSTWNCMSTLRAMGKAERAHEEPIIVRPATAAANGAAEAESPRGPGIPATAQGPGRLESIY